MTAFAARLAADLFRTDLWSRVHGARCMCVRACAQGRPAVTTTRTVFHANEPLREWGGGDSQVRRKFASKDRFAKAGTDAQTAGCV